MEKPVQVLLVEDNPPDARLLREMLSELTGVKFAVVVEAQLAQALSRLATERFDIVLTDLSLPDSEGLEQVIYVAGMIETRSPQQNLYAAPEAILLRVKPSKGVQISGDLIPGGNTGVGPKK